MLFESLENAIPLYVRIMHDCQVKMPTFPLVSPGAPQDRLCVLRLWFVANVRSRARAVEGNQTNG